jgi:tetratricopeptide (TPR) repeat protein
MALKGELLSADLSNVFQMLAMNGKRGLLTVQDRFNPVIRRRFYLDAQTVLLAESVTRRPSLALLVEMGRVTFDQYLNATQRARRFSSDPFGILKAQGVVSDEDIEACRARAATEMLLEVFLWRDIRFDLDESVSQPPEADSPPLQLDHVIMEAARRQDEWRHIVQAVGSHREVFRRCQDDPDLSVLTPVERIVYEYVEGIDSTPDIMAKSDLPRYFVDLGLAALLRAGLISRLGSEELMIAGNRLIEQRRFRDGIRLFHCALRADRASLAIHNRLAEAHEQAGECARASAHLRFCSVLEIRDGRRREALTYLQRAWNLLPTHFSTLERILSVILEEPDTLTPDDRACVADSRRLLQVWHDTGEHDRALELALRLWAIDQSDQEVLHTAARLSVRLGRIEAAIEMYRLLAERMRAENNLKAALDVYRMIASLDAKAGRAFEGVIAEIKAGMERRFVRKKQGQGIRSALMTLAVMAVLYAGYAWFGEQVVRDLEDRLAADAGSRDEVMPKLKKAAFWFGLAPAGAKAEHRATMLAADAEAEADAQRLVNEQAAERIATRHREGAAAVAEGLRKVKAGDLVGAADCLKAGIAAFPTPDCSAAATARKTLSDLESYLKQGRRLLREARDIEATDPDAAFRLRLRAMREFDLVPEIKTLKLQLRIETVPAEARLNVNAAPEDQAAPVGILVEGQGHLSIEAKAPGYLPRNLSISLPPEVATLVIVLERVPRETLKTRQAVTSVVPTGETRALVTARTGPVLVVDSASGSVVAEFKPDAIESQSRPPVVSGGRALCLLDDDRVRVLDLPWLAHVRTTRLGSRRGVVPVALARGGWAVATNDSAIEVLDKDGLSVRRFHLPPEVEVRDLAVIGDTIFCAAGEVGILSMNPKDPAIRTVSPRFTASLASGPDGSLLAHRRQAGVVRIDVATGLETMVLPHPGEACRIRKTRSDVWVAIFDGEIAFFSGKAPLGRAKLRGAGTESVLVVDPHSGNAGVIANGWCSIYSATDGSCVGGYACEPGTTPAYVGRLFVKPRPDGRVTFTEP